MKKLKSLPSPGDCLTLVGPVVENALDWKCHAEALLESCPRHAFVAAVYALEEEVKCFWLAGYGLGVITNKSEAAEFVSRHDLKHRFSAVVAYMPALEAVESLLAPAFAKMEKALSEIEGWDADIQLPAVAPVLNEHLGNVLDQLAQVLPTVLASWEDAPEWDASLVDTVGRWETLRQAAIYVDPGDHPEPPVREDCEQCLDLVTKWEPVLFLMNNLSTVPSETLGLLRRAFASQPPRMIGPGQ